MEARTMWQGMRSFGAIVGSVVLAMVLAGGARRPGHQADEADGQAGSRLHRLAQRTSPPSPASCRRGGDKPDPACRPSSRRSRRSTGSAASPSSMTSQPTSRSSWPGLDPQTGDYTDPLEALKKELDEVKSDASIPDADKKQLVGGAHRRHQVDPAARAQGQHRGSSRSTARRSRRRCSRGRRGQDEL